MSFCSLPSFSFIGKFFVQIHYDREQAALINFQKRSSDKPDNDLRQDQVLSKTVSVFNSIFYLSFASQNGHFFSFWFTIFSEHT